MADLVRRFILSRDYSWELTKEEFNEAHKELTNTTFLVVDHNTKFYIVNKDYIKVKATKKAGTNGDENRNVDNPPDAE